MQQQFNLALWRISREIMVYLLTNPCLMQDQNNLEIFKNIRELRIEQTLMRSPHMSYEEAIITVDLLSDCEQQLEPSNKIFSQETLNLFRNRILPKDYKTLVKKFNQLKNK